MIYDLEEFKPTRLLKRVLSYDWLEFSLVSRYQLFVYTWARNITGKCRLVVEYTYNLASLRASLMKCQ